MIRCNCFQFVELIIKQSMHEKASHVTTTHCNPSLTHAVKILPSVCCYVAKVTNSPGMVYLLVANTS
jgi:hypothetical protein